MKLRQLQFFIAVAEELSFSRAAIKLHVAQPSLSTQIQALEDEVGARLFERDKRHVSLTPAGRRFQNRVASILFLADSAKAEARSTERGQLGTIDLGYTALSMFSTALPHAIRRFRQQEPNVVITLRELTSLEQLHELGERTLDVGVLRKVDVSAPKGISIVEWYRTPLVAAIPKDHPGAASDSLSLADLKNEAFIMYPRQAGTGIYWQVMNLCTTAGFRPRVVRRGARILDDHRSGCRGGGHRDRARRHELHSIFRGRVPAHNRPGGALDSLPGAARGRSQRTSTQTLHGAQTIRPPAFGAAKP